MIEVALFLAVIGAGIAFLEYRNTRRELGEFGESGMTGLKPSSQKESESSILEKKESESGAPRTFEEMRESKSGAPQTLEEMERQVEEIENVAKARLELKQIRDELVDLRGRLNKHEMDAVSFDKDLKEIWESVQEIEANGSVQATGIVVELEKVREKLRAFEEKIGLAQQEVATKAI